MTLPVDLKIPIRNHVPLKSYSTFKIGGPAEFFAEPHTREELFRVLDFGLAEGLSPRIIGRGSNLLISDEGLRGLVISLRQFEPDFFSVEEGSLLRVSGGMSLFRFAQLSEELSLGGAEFVCHIPGTVGGSVIMNAGFGRRANSYHEMKDILDSFTAVEADSGRTKTFRLGDLAFEYRGTNIPLNLIILEAVFQLTPKPRALVHEEIKANFDYRNSVQDLRYPSAGSTFKNPKGFYLTSGQLLERVRMKGVRVGGARVSERHANFFLNVDHASAQDVLALMGAAEKRVFEEFGISLEPEVRYVGRSASLPPCPAGHDSETP